MSVCLSCPAVLSVTFVYCGQKVGQIKTKLGMQVGLGPDHIVLDGDPGLPSPNKGQSPPPFSSHVYCAQTARWIKMPLGVEVGLNPSVIVLAGEQLPLPKGGRPPIVGPCLLWPNGCMDQMPLGMEVGLGPGHIVLDRDPAPPPHKRGYNPLSDFRPMFVVAIRLDGSRCQLVRK